MKEKEKILADLAWEQMEGILDTHMPVKKKRFFGMWWWIGVSAVVMVSTFSYLSFYNLNNELPSNEASTDSIYASNEKLDNKIEERQNSSDNTTTYIEENKSNDELTRVEKSEEIDDRNNEADIISPTIKSKEEIYIESKEYNVLNSTVKDDGALHQTFEDRRIVPNFDKKSGRSAIKKQLDKVYDLSFSNSDNNLKADEVSVKFIDVQNRSLLDSYTILPTKLDDVFSFFNIEEDDIENRSSLIPITVSPRGTWNFGVFGSYQYLDKYFKGYDLGLTANYHMRNVGIGVRVGYENLVNSSEQVLQDAVIGLSNNSNSTLLQSSQLAGFELNDLILQKNNFMAEINLSYALPWNVSLSSGIGYKKLLEVSTRPISGFNPDDMSSTDFNPELDTNELLDGNRVLNNPSVNRNRIYIPIEIGYRPIKNIQFGIGSQLFLNSVFEGFEEKNKSIYSRVSILF